MTREEAINILDRRTTIPGEGFTWEQINEAIDMAVAALRTVIREQVEKAWRGTWMSYLPPLGAGDEQCRCTGCGRTPDVKTPFCAWCGAAMTDEAVQMVMERLEAMKDGKGDND